MANQDFQEYEGEHVDEDGVVTRSDVATIDTSAMTALAGIEIDRQIATARRFPRMPSRIQKAIFDLATLDEEASKESMYALPRGGKPITGPSIRFAETVKQAFGNCRASSRVVEINRTDRYVESEGIFLDLETNVATKITHRRRIVDKRGRLFSDDMVLMTGNAACSIAMREAILKGVPKPIWRKGYEAVTKVVTGDVKTLVERRDRAVKAFAAYGVKPEQVYGVLGVAGEEDILMDHLPVLFGMFSAIKNGEHTVEEMFAPPKALHEPVKNPLDDKPDDPAPKGADATVLAHKDAASNDTGFDNGRDHPKEDGTKPADDFPGDKPTSSAIADARKKGADAFSKGLPRGAVPAGFKIEKRKAELDAWHEGFDEAAKVKDGEPL